MKSVRINCLNSLPNVSYSALKISRTAFNFPRDWFKSWSSCLLRSNCTCLRSINPSDFNSCFNSLQSSSDKSYQCGTSNNIPCKRISNHAKSNAGSRLAPSNCWKCFGNSMPLCRRKISVAERYFGSFKRSSSEMVPSSARLVLTASQNIESDDRFFKKALFCVENWSSCFSSSFVGKEKYT